MTYSRFFDSSAEDQDGYSKDALERATSWYKKWLARDSTFTPQPYQHMGEMLNRAGLSDIGSEILLAGKKRERKQASLAKNVWMRVQEYTVGYGLGLKYFRSLWWVAGMILIVAILIIFFGNCCRELHCGLIDNVLLGVSSITPINLEERRFASLVGCMGGWRFILYGFKIFGLVLISLVAAGLAGIFKK